MLLNEHELDVFKELLNIGVGKAASLLNELVQSPIKLSIPNIIVQELSVFIEEYIKSDSNPYFAVKLNFDGTFSGVAEIVFPSEIGNNLVSVLTGEEKYSEELDNVRVGTLNEVANMLLNGVMGSISNSFKESFQYSIPVYYEDTFQNLLTFSSHNQVILMGETHFEVEQLSIEGDIIILLEIPSFESLKAELNKLLENL